MKKMTNAIEKIQITIGVIFLCVFFGIIVLQIVTRHLGISVVWTEEAANYSFIWAVFMGAAVMVNRREHFNFDFLVQKLKGKKRAYLSIFNDAILFIFNICIFLLGVQVVSEFWNYTWSSIPQMKMGYVWLVIPVMAATMLIYTTSHFVEHIRIIKAKEVHE
ncbi:MULTISPECIES: TRAP transporter small permease [Oceanobacillus]|uniref:C4-dicarboxylate ABC transporter permease n=1 Tax=Oceanobacillus kimchii TaxID=746691 RepID=A0ABQ5TLK6_9BACI|nr:MULTISPECIES: TRAP transporter small permease [Oceanobacillus]MBT2600306.1 TRAP transporter small permease [Oceanobacillus sp. ISL-74]MBT2650464.1 TRAP transporter small permease [Oceanobacillus sp. ISL-73]MCT1578208.1 TRAP transporter small permease [Oceanobacillus kimchii]MCT2134386.1 TRAP transporter small permease [Oceanobacillus kimchii]GLO67355.1 C4-dicarboxylate ABC transporter permease [Oceanobacillus kimchii]